MVMSVQPLNRQRVDRADDWLRSIVESIPAIVYQVRIGAAAEVIYVCSQLEAMLGWTADEYRAHPEYWLRHVHPLDQERVRAMVAHGVATREPLHMEYRVLTRDGDVVWLRDLAVFVTELADGN